MPPRHPGGTGLYMNALILPGAQPNPQHILDTPPQPRSNMAANPLGAPSQSGHPPTSTAAPGAALPPSPGPPQSLLMGLSAPSSPMAHSPQEPAILSSAPSLPSQHPQAPRGLRLPRTPPPPRAKVRSCLRAFTPAAPSTWNSPLQTQAQLLSFLNQLPLSVRRLAVPFST